LGSRNKNTNTQNYKEIKEFCSARGMLSQCILVSGPSDIQKKTGPSRHTILNNIMRQIINKFGSLCWWAPIESITDKYKNKVVMILGVDVHHGKKRFVDGDKIYRQRRSIGGFIATLIDQQGVYRSSCGITRVKARREIVGNSTPQQQQQQQEGKSSTGTTSSGTTSSSDSDEKGPSEELGGPDSTRNNALHDFVKRVCEEHNLVPDIIICYRDGVSESQLPDVRKFEYGQVRQACPDAKITYFVLQKGVHSKFIVKQDNSYGNPEPGTLIESDAKILEYQDFYLIPTKKQPQHCQTCSLHSSA